MAIMNRNYFTLAILIAVFNSGVSNSEILDELFEENQLLKKEINLLKMDCQEMTVQCRERESSLESESIFNQNYEESLERNIDEWPNNELDEVKKALSLRKLADKSFKDGFFGRSAKQYDEASMLIRAVLDEANKKLEENLKVGERYLYEKDKPEWAKAYINDALKYDPDNERVRRAIDTINFRENYDRDFSKAKELNATGNYAKAISLLENLISGSPDDKRAEIQTLLDDSKVLLKKQDVDRTARSFQKSYDDGEDRMAILEKIDNALEIYGENESTLALVKLRDKLIDETYNEAFATLKDAYINQSESWDKLLKDAELLLRLNPDESELRDIYQQINLKRSEESFVELYKEAQKSVMKEDWQSAKDQLTEATNYSSDGSEQELLIIVNAISVFIEDMNDIMSNSTKRLNTKTKITQIKNNIENIRLAKEESLQTPNLDIEIQKLEKKIATYESLIAEDESSKASSSQRKSTNNRSSNTQKSSSTEQNTQRSTNNRSSNTQKSSSAEQNTQRSSSSQNSSTSATTSAATSSKSTKPKLDMKSFQANLVCKKRTKNKKMTVVFSIVVSASGKAISVTPVNGDEFTRSAEETVLGILEGALNKAKYTPGTKNGINISSTFERKLTAPERFCT